MKGLRLTGSERHRLREQLKETQDAHVDRRTLAVLEVSRGQSIVQAAHRLDVTPQSIHDWTATYIQAHDPRALRDGLPEFLVKAVR